MPEPSPELLAVMAVIEQAGCFPQLRETEIAEGQVGIYSAVRKDKLGWLRAPVLWTYRDLSGRWVVGTGLDGDYYHVPDDRAVASVSIELLRTMGIDNRIPE